MTVASPLRLRRNPWPLNICFYVEKDNWPASEGDWDDMAGIHENEGMEMPEPRMTALTAVALSQSSRLLSSPSLLLLWRFRQKPGGLPEEGSTEPARYPTPVLT